MIVALLFTGCSPKTPLTSESTETTGSTETTESIETTEQTTEFVGLEASTIKGISVSSEVLGKEMAVNIYLPKGYNSETEYAVLYLFHGFGAGSDEYFWLPKVRTHLKADELMESGKIEPMIIVSPLYNNSFGYNTSNEMAFIDPTTKYAYGRYEDYIIQELIPYVDAEYSTKASSEWRYIGGFSGGGSAALFLAFKHNDLFSKVGAHCPALLAERHLTESFKAFLYPTEEALIERHPTYMAQTMEAFPIKIYLDAAENDDFREEIKSLYEILEEKGMDVAFSINEGYHDLEYARNNVEKYLLFYGTKPNE